MSSLRLDVPSVADWIVIVESLLALAGLSYFVVRYAVSTRGDWSRSRTGRHLMAFRFSLGAFMLMIIAHNFIAEYPGRDLVRVLVIGALAATVYQGDLLLEWGQREHRKRRAQHLSGRTDLHPDAAPPDRSTHHPDEPSLY